MTEEEKRYALIDGQIVDKKVGFSFDKRCAVKNLNAYESRVKELEKKISRDATEDLMRRSNLVNGFDKERNQLSSRIKELEQAIDKALANINCDASEAAMRPLIEIMEGK